MRRSEISDDIILVMPPTWQADMPPLGLAYLASFLSANNIKVEILDLNVKLFNACASKEKHLWDVSTISNFSQHYITRSIVKKFDKEIKAHIKIICDSPAKLIGFSVTFASVNVALNIAQQIKSKDPSKIIIFGGSGCFYDTLSIGEAKIVDIFVIGEGELPLLEIVKRFKAKPLLSNLFGIKGTIVLTNSSYHNFLPPNHAKDINIFPFPTFKGFDLDEYNQGFPNKSLPLLISRGCVNKCSFCIDHKMNYPFRYKDPNKVVEELKYHVYQNNKSAFRFNDLLCNGNLRQLEEICNLIIKENLNVRWSSYATIRKGMSPELLEKMRRAGCTYICYGMESISDEVLKKMNKKYDKNLAEEVIRNTHNAGVDTSINIIVGHPGESSKTFKETCEFLSKNKDYIYEVTNVSTCFLMPGADLFQNFNNYGIYFKTTVKDRIKSLLKHRKCTPDVQKFYTCLGNSPKMRTKWLRNLLLFLNKQNTAVSVINYYKANDRNLDKFFKVRLRDINVIKYKNFKLNYTGRRCKLYFKDKELTKDVGFNTSFNIGGSWTDSTAARWVVRQQDDYLVIKIKWLRFNIFQEWTMQFIKNYINWNVKTYFNEELKLLQYKIGIMLSNNYDKYLIDDKVFKFPNHFDNAWQQIVFLRTNKGILVSDNGLPSVIFESKPENHMAMQLQNAPIRLSAKMINYCLLDNSQSKDYNDTGKYFKKGDILEKQFKIYIKRK